MLIGKVNREAESNPYLSGNSAHAKYGVWDFHTSPLRFLVACSFLDGAVALARHKALDFQNLIYLDDRNTKQV